MNLLEKDKDGDNEQQKAPLNKRHPPHNYSLLFGKLSVSLLEIMLITAYCLLITDY
jgi:hypothetical protein